MLKLTTEDTHWDNNEIKLLGRYFMSLCCSSGLTTSPAMPARQPRSRHQAKTCSQHSTTASFEPARQLKSEQPVCAFNAATRCKYLGNKETLLRLLIPEAKPLLQGPPAGCDSLPQVRLLCGVCVISLPLLVLHARRELDSLGNARQQRCGDMPLRLWRPYQVRHKMFSPWGYLCR